MKPKLSHQVPVQNRWIRLFGLIMLGIGIGLFPTTSQAKPAEAETIYLPAVQTNGDSTPINLVYDFATGSSAELRQLESVLSVHNMQVAGNEDQIEFWTDVAGDMQKVLEIFCSGNGCMEGQADDHEDGHADNHASPRETNLEIIIELTDTESLRLIVETLTRVKAVLVKDGKNVASVLFICSTEDCVIHIDKSDLEAEPTPEPEETPVVEPEPEETPVVDPPTQPGKGIEPYAGAPLCAEHDPRAWHSLWNAELGCHYDHEHKDDPHLVDDIFGTDYYQWAGGELSYPWQTFHGAGTGYPASPGAGHMENDMKHEGYMWLVRRDMTCGNAKTNGCITDMRVQVHAIFSGVGAVTRFHSYWYEARVCIKADPNRCGIVRNGGWLDFGYLVGEGPNCPAPCIVSLPGMPDPDTIKFPTGPKRGHGWINRFGGNAAGATWYGINRYPGMQNKVALLTDDVWQNIDVDNPSAINLACPDFQCQYNGSTVQLHQFSFILRDDAFGAANKYSSGTMNYTGYTDRYGGVVTNCSEPSLDCIPLRIENAPTVGKESNLTRFEHTDDSNGIRAIEYDVSPPGEWWIEYPN